jgi:hypothetical protein
MTEPIDYAKEMREAAATGRLAELRAKHKPNELQKRIAEAQRQVAAYNLSQFARWCNYYPISGPVCCIVPDEGLSREDDETRRQLANRAYLVRE